MTLTPPIKPMTPEDLRKNMVATYFTLRGALVLLSFALPVWLYIYSASAHGKLNESSISAFYGADGERVRNYFVGTLCVVGALLAVYKGFSAFEKWLLRAAGAAAILVAITPCDCWHPVDGTNAWHNTFAITFFACMAVVCEFCAFDTITLLPTKRLQDRFRTLYHAIGVLLVLSPLAAIAVAYSANLRESVLFFVEGAAVWVFAGFWSAKSVEFEITSAEKKVLTGQVRKAKGYGLVPADVSDEQLYGTPPRDAAQAAGTP